MAEDELQRLEREARAGPADVAAQRRYAQALARTGDVGEAWVTLWRAGLGEADEAQSIKRALAARQRPLLSELLPPLPNYPALARAGSEAWAHEPWAFRTLSVAAVLERELLPVLSVKLEKRYATRSWEDADAVVAARVPGLLELGLVGLPEVTAAATDGLADARQLEHLWLHDCAQVGDAFLAGVAASPARARLRVLTLGELWQEGGVTAAGLRQLHELRALRRLVLRASTHDPLPPGHLLGVAGLERLEALDLYGCRDLPDDELAAVGTLATLSELRLTMTSFRDEALQHLARLERLELLDCANSNVVGPGLVHLRACPLRVLSLGGLTDASAELVERFETLEELRAGGIGSPGPSDRGARRVARLTRLTRLELGAKQLTARGLGHLRALESLQDLQLRYPKLTRAGAERLAALPALERLALWEPHRDSLPRRDLTRLLKGVELTIHEHRIQRYGRQV